MAETIKTCPRILALLETFYRPDGEEPPWQADIVDAEQVPQPYRQLLVHNNDMTSTLTKFHGEEIRVHVLERVRTHDGVARHIVLERRDDRRAVEYGASRIRLDVLDEETRAKIHEEHLPLGGILNASGVVYDNCPGAYFTVRSNGVINRVFQLQQSQWLYGRCNCLRDQLGNTIAEVVEVLPPLPLD